MFATRTMQEWDSTFVANVARDGLLLWARGSLPAPLKTLERRQQQPSRHGDNTDARLTSE